VLGKAAVTCICRGIALRLHTWHPLSSAQRIAEAAEAHSVPGGMHEPCCLGLLLNAPRLQRQYFKEAETAGLIKPKPPTPKAEPKTLLETLGVPDHVTTVTSDPIQVSASGASKYQC
jgi:hypothetical protein